MTIPVDQRSNLILSNRCDECRYWSHFYDDGEAATGLCSYPNSLLPVSMAGVANLERESVRGDENTCPVWVAKIVQSRNVS